MLGIMIEPGVRCDERFTGYGGNKAACLFELYLSGVTFYVMADHFLIHQSHKYEEEARREEVSRGDYWRRSSLTSLQEEIQPQAIRRFQGRDLSAVGLIAFPAKVMFDLVP